MWNDDYDDDHDYYYEELETSRGKFRDVCVLIQTATILFFGFCTIGFAIYAITQILQTAELTNNSQHLLCIGLSVFICIYAMKYPWGIPRFDPISDFTEYDDGDDGDDGEKEELPEKEDSLGTAQDSQPLALVQSLCERRDKVAKQ